MHSRKYPLVLSIVLYLFMAAAPAAALGDPFTISINPEAAAVYAGKVAAYNATITSNLNTYAVAEIFIRGRARTPWITLNTYSLNLSPGETKSFPFYITPAYGTKQDTYVFDFSASEKENVSISAKKEAILFVLETSGVNITAFKPSKSEYDMGEKITVLAGVKNTGTSRSKRIYMALAINGATVAGREISVPPLDVDEEKIFSEDFIFDKFAAHGTYSATLDLFNELGDKVASATTSFFSVESKPVFEKEERAKSGLLYRSVEITVKNTGNERGTETITSDAPIISSAYIYEKQPSTETIGGKKMSVWRCDLAPNESCTIRYEVRYWSYLVAVALAVIFLYLVLKNAERPTVKKRYVRGKEHKVHLEIRNNSRKTLEDVQVSDFVPSAFDVVEGAYGTIIPSIVKKRTGGTDLIWNIGKFAPGEERVFTYTIRPALQLIGTIKLPNAKIIAKDSKGKEYKGISSRIAVE